MDEGESTSTEMDEDPSVDALISDVEKHLQTFERSLPRRIDPIALSRSKLPFRALACREVLIWRVTELGRTALENVHADRLVAAILLTRAAIETTAALWYLSTKLNIALKTGNIGDLDSDLAKLSAGTRNWKDEGWPEAFNVLKFVDCAEKTFSGFRYAYDALSEYSHPNYLGTTGLYSRTDHKEILIDFGPDAARLKYPKYICALNLSVALRIFEDTYGKLADLMPAFIALCETHLGSKAAGQA
jgi:hypothetical protein